MSQRVPSGQQGNYLFLAGQNFYEAMPAFHLFIFGFGGAGRAIFVNVLGDMVIFPASSSVL